MRQLPYLLSSTLLLIPAEAVARDGSVLREFATRPLDFANLGIVLATLVLLRWPRTVRSVLDEPSALAADELAPPSDAGLGASSSSDPNTGRVFRRLVFAAAIVISLIGALLI